MSQDLALGFAVSPPGNCLSDSICLGEIGRSRSCWAASASVTHVLQELRPLCRSLEWELADLYWATRGVAPFIRDEVPNLINNSGRACEDAAVLLFTNCQEAEPLEDQITVLELGGLGLFALLFLNAFRDVCAQEKGAITTIGCSTTPRIVRRGPWSSGARGGCSPTMPITWSRCSAMCAGPGNCACRKGDGSKPAGLRMVLANYVLDVLPSAVVRTGPTGPETLCVRTHLVRDAALRGQYTRLGIDEILGPAASDDTAQRAELLPLLTLLEFEARYQPVGDDPPAHLDEALSFGEGLDGWCSTTGRSTASPPAWSGCAGGLRTG